MLNERRGGGRTLHGSRSGRPGALRGAATLVVDWLTLEARALSARLTRGTSRQQARARRRLQVLPARLIANSLVEGQLVRLRGRITFDASVANDERLRAVDLGGPMPDFALQLDDGVIVAVAAREAALRGLLEVLDLWEDRQTGVTCDERTRALFRRSRFRPGQSVEVCGLTHRATASLLVDAGAESHRREARWRLVAGQAPLSLLFTAGRPVP